MSRKFYWRLKKSSLHREVVTFLQFYPKQWLPESVLTYTIQCKQKVPHRHLAVVVDLSVTCIIVYMVLVKIFPILCSKERRFSNTHKVQSIFLPFYIIQCVSDKAQANFLTGMSFCCTYWNWNSRHVVSV
jgi:hypothetical protein